MCVCIHIYKCHDSALSSMTQSYMPKLYAMTHSQRLYRGAPWLDYGVATISRLLKSIGLFCKRALQKRPIFSKETYNFKEPTNRSHPI